MKSERFEALSKRHTTTGNLDYFLEVFGFELAKRHKYKDLDGMDAVRLYLVNKHHWLPRDVRAMSGDDLRFALHEEMQDWIAPQEAR